MYVSFKFYISAVQRGGGGENVLDVLYIIWYLQQEVRKCARAHAHTHVRAHTHTNWFPYIVKTHSGEILHLRAPW